MMVGDDLPGAVPAVWRFPSTFKRPVLGRLRWNREGRTGRIDGKTLENEGATGRKGLLAEAVEWPRTSRNSAPVSDRSPQTSHGKGFLFNWFELKQNLLVIPPDGMLVAEVSFDVDHKVHAGRALADFASGEGNQVTSHWLQVEYVAGPPLTLTPVAGQRLMHP
jgi:hypothetical protein